jgi:transcription initiation factor TFIIB
MECETYFDFLDEIQEQTKEKDVKCCDDRCNYMQGNGVILCKVCENTISNIVESPEWKFYGHESRGSDQNRCGMPTNELLPKSSLGSSVNVKSYSESSNKIGMYQRWNSMPYKERSLYKVFNDIDIKCLSNDLPRIIATTAKSLYRIISETKIKRGANRRGIIAACVYNACKECGVPRTINELSQLFDIDSKIMTKGCKNYTETMRLSKTDISRIQNTKSIDLSDFIERFCHNLGIGTKVVSVIQSIAELCQDLNLVSDNTPPSMASGCIYLYVRTHEIEITKKEIADICKISEVTVNKCYKKIETNEIISDFMKGISTVNAS